MDYMSFGKAIEALKDGKKVTRPGWNGKGMFLIMVPATTDAVLREGTPYHTALASSGKTTVTINSHIDMFTAAGEFQPGWLASQADMQANDWLVAE